MNLLHTNFTCGFITMDFTYRFVTYGFRSVCDYIRI